jgi:hypothetical protein
VARRAYRTTPAIGKATLSLLMALLASLLVSCSADDRVEPRASRNSIVVSPERPGLNHEFVVTFAGKYARGRGETYLVAEKQAGRWSTTFVVSAGSSDGPPTFAPYTGSFDSTSIGLLRAADRLIVPPVSADRIRFCNFAKSRLCFSINVRP